MAGLTPATRKKRSPRSDSEATNDSPLKFISTMQPKQADVPPTGDGWLHEIKYDGYRIQLHVDAGKVTAYTRNGFGWTAKFPAIARAAHAVRARRAIIDGEICVQDAAGITDFAALPEAIRTRQQDLVCFAFDLLWLDGEDLRPAPLEERRARLRLLISQVPGSRIMLSDEYDGEGQAFFDLVNAHGLEGMVSKRKSSRYWSGPSTAWIKTKCWTTETLNVIGVKAGDDGLPYALLARGGQRVGAAIVSLKAKERAAFWRHVDAQAFSRQWCTGRGRETRPGYGRA